MQQQSFGDTVEKMIVSDRIVDPLCVSVTSEYGWPANVERITKAQALGDSSTAPCTMSEKTTKVNPTPSTMTELKESRRTSLTRRIREHKFSEQAEIVKVAHTIPQERLPKRFL